MEAELVAAIAADPTDGSLRAVYADWLEQAGDPRCHFVRAHQRIAPLPPDHPDRDAGEHELSVLRAGLDAAWLAAFEPERVRPSKSSYACACFGGDDDDVANVAFHREPQDTTCDAWKRLLDAVEDAAAHRSTQFDLREVLSPEDVPHIVTLPRTIGKLVDVAALVLYASQLVRLPREIGAMANLQSFTPYTSYRLHWFPYEITRCTRLVDSTVSTRTLYGNFKLRLPFPALGPAIAHGPTRPCSVCDRPFEDLQQYRVWISRRVATDVLPLLVNACSEACVARLPPPDDEYVATPHRGGPDVVQPRSY